ncbi:MAG TPA: hypothetical protein VI072_12140 [Polyangiaceae bacterium]
MKRLGLSLGLPLGLLVLGCVGDTDPADSITATSARLKARGSCSTGTCDFYFEWGKCTRPIWDLVCNYTARQAWNDIAVPANVNLPITHDVTGLEPGTTYVFRICGKEANQPDNAYACGTARHFVTGTNPAAPRSPRYAAASTGKAGALTHALNSRQGRDVGASVLLGGRLVWFFGDTALTVRGVDGRAWRTSTAAHGPAGPFAGNYPALDDATAPSEHLDANRAAKQFVVYTASEPEFVGDRHFYHWPKYGITRTVGGREEALIFFSRGAFDGQTPSVGYVDVTRDGVQTTGSAERVKLWDPAGANGDQYWPVDVEEGGYRYFATAKNINGFSARVFLARVPPLEATNPSAYRFWNVATRTWQAQQVSTACVKNACTVPGTIDISLFGSYHTSITRNPYLNQYVLVSGTGSGAMIYVANALTGPWSAGTNIPSTQGGTYGFIDSTATEGLPNYHARENVHLRSADGRTLILSYLHAVDEGPANRGVKLVRLTLER